MLSALRRAQPALLRASATAPLACAQPALRLPAFSVASASRTFASSSVFRSLPIRFTAEHEWVQFDEGANVGTIGITKYAQKSLGDVVYVELPSEGSEVQQGEQIGAVESVKAASDIYSPVTGQIEKVNDKLGDEPGLLNKSPEQDGWLCKIKLSNPAEFEQLLDADAYGKLTDDA